MGARALSKSAATRQRILDATAEVLNAKGYAGTRLSDIAEVAGVQPTAVYYYFDSRDKVIGEAVQEGLRRVLAAVEDALAALPPSATPMDRISAAVAAHLQATLRDSKYGAVALRLASSLPPAIREVQLVNQRRYGMLWRTLIVDPERAGLINPALDAAAARMLILGSLNLGGRVVGAVPRVTDPHDHDSSTDDPSGAGCTGGLPVTRTSAKGRWTPRPARSWPHAGSRAVPPPRRRRP